MKQKRHEKILSLIREYDIETQDELASRLKDEGICVTQATISRDIRQLGLTKATTRNGRQKYVSAAREASQPEEAYIQVLRSGFESMETASHLLVLKTGSGMAMAVAAALDSMRLPQVAGCIAGDDTIMVAVRSAEDTQKLRRTLEELLGLS